eukprot:948418-Prorocentrum_minimum.AAC.1
MSHRCRGRPASSNRRCGAAKRLQTSPRDMGAGPGSQRQRSGGATGEFDAAESGRRELATMLCAPSL